LSLSTALLILVYSFFRVALRRKTQYRFSSAVARIFVCLFILLPLYVFSLFYYLFTHLFVYFIVSLLIYFFIFLFILFISSGPEFDQRSDSQRGGRARYIHLGDAWYAVRFLFHPLYITVDIMRNCTHCATNDLIFIKPHSAKVSNVNTLV
jgi:hypothetical protein